MLAWKGKYFQQQQTFPPRASIFPEQECLLTLFFLLRLLLVRRERVATRLPVFTRFHEGCKMSAVSSVRAASVNQPHPTAPSTIPFHKSLRSDDARGCEGAFYGLPASRRLPHGGETKEKHFRWRKKVKTTGGGKFTTKRETNRTRFPIICV